MKKIILCEGKTDAFLLGYFLDKRFSWKYIKEHIDRLPKLCDVMVRNQREGTSTERFRQIVIFFDRDTRTKG